MRTVDEISKDMEALEKELQTAYSSTRKDWEGDEDKDKVYDVDIHLFRHPGMGNSVQKVIGDKISVCVALTSLFHTLMTRNLITENELLKMVMMASEDTKNVSSDNKDEI